MASTDKCKNCEESLGTNFNFCPNCGQETANKLTFGILFSNTISNYFSIDSRFFKSFIPLMTRPGLLARRFVDGKRLLFLHPARFYLFISVVFFFIFSFSIRKADNKLSEVLKQEFNNETLQDSLAVIMDSVNVSTIDKEFNENQSKIRTSDENNTPIDIHITSDEENSFHFRQEVLDSLIAIEAPQSEKLLAMGKKEDSGIFITKLYTQLLKLYEQKGGGILKTLYDTIPIAMFVLLPLFALLLKLFYWKKSTYAQHIVFSFYFFIFLFTTFCFRILANTFIDIPIWLDVFVFSSFIIYLTLALRNFYESHWLGAFFKAIFISLMYMLIVLPFAITGVIFVSLLLY